MPTTSFVKIEAETVNLMLQKYQQFTQENSTDLALIQLDSIVDLQVENLEQIFALLNSKQIIASFRSLQAGGNFAGTDEIWKQFNQKLLDLKPAWIDLEFEKMQLLDLQKKDEKTKLIVSFVDLNCTTGYRNLRKIVKRMRGYKPQIMNFETKIKTQKDELNLIRLLLSRKKSDLINILPLGNKTQKLTEITEYLGNSLKVVG